MMQWWADYIDGKTKIRLVMNVRVKLKILICSENDLFTEKPVLVKL